MPPRYPELCDFNYQGESAEADKPCQEVVWVADSKRPPREKIDSGMLQSMWENRIGTKLRRHNGNRGNRKQQYPTGGLS